MDELRPGDPEQIGPYRLLGRVGAGGMGVVYLAEARTGARAALKVIRPDLADDPGFRERFAREVASARRVQSQVTAAVVDADPIAEQPWVAFEYIDAPNLAQVVSRGVPRRSAAVGILAGVAEALAAIHSAWLIHRDLKPANVLVAHSGVVVIDFGIAAALDASTLTGTSHMIGTPAWLAPEQIRGQRVTPAADIFAWGTLAMYTTTGHHPFSGLDQAPAAVMYRIVNERPDLTGLPPEMRSIVTSALNPDPDARPTAPELIRALLPGVSPDLPTVIAPRPPTDPTTIAPRAVADTVISSPVAAGSARGPSRRRMLIAVVAVAIVLVAGGIAAALTLHSGPHHPLAANTITTTTVVSKPSKTTTPVSATTPVVPTTPEAPTTARIATTTATTVAAAVNVAVTSCPTEYGVDGTTGLPVPASLSLPSSEAGNLTGFSNGYVSALGPTDWSCSALVAADGGRSLVVYPADESEPQVGDETGSSAQAVLIDIPSSQTEPANDLACPFFASAAAISLVPCQAPPAQEAVHYDGSNIVEFEDPPGVTGDADPSGGPYPANGVIIWDPTNRYSAEAVCTLPNNDRSECTAILNAFIAKYQSES